MTQLVLKKSRSTVRPFASPLTAFGCFALCTVIGHFAMANETCPERPNTSEAATALASDWFGKASQLIDDEQFEQGSSAYMCSYSLMPHPASLLNAALAAQKATQFPRACELFQMYLNIQNDADKAQKVQVTMKELKCDSAAEPSNATVDTAVDSDVPFTPTKTGTKSEQTPAVEETTEPNNGDTALPATKPSEPSRESPADIPGYHSLRLTGTVLFTSGSIGLATAAVLQLLAAHYAKLGETTSNSSTAETYIQRTDRFQAGAYAGYVSGGILFFTGVVLLVTAKRRNRRYHQTNQPALHLTPLGLGVMGEF